MKMISTLLLGLSLTAFAEPQEDFATKKAKMLEKMDKKISLMQASRSCVSSVNDEAALKACRQSMRSQMRELKGHRKEKNKN